MVFIDIYLNNIINVYFSKKNVNFKNHRRKRASKQLTSFFDGPLISKNVFCIIMEAILYFTQWKNG